MKRKKILKWYCLVIPVLLTVALSGCSLFGLKKQTDFHRRTDDTIDAHVNKTAWAYIKSRAYGSTKDTLYRRMYDAIIYSGIDTNEYIKPNRTYILLNNNSTKALWAGVYTAAKKAGKKWQDYPAADVKNYLLYLIIEGQYSHCNLPTSDVDCKTLCPAGTYTTNPTAFTFHAGFNSNPNSILKMKVLDSSPSNTSDYPLYLNDVTAVQTSDLLATNGVLQSLNVIFSPSQPL